MITCFHQIPREGYSGSHLPDDTKRNTLTVSILLAVLATVTDSCLAVYSTTVCSSMYLMAPLTGRGYNNTDTYCAIRLATENKTNIVDEDSTII